MAQQSQLMNRSLESCLGLN